MDGMGNTFGCVGGDVWVRSPDPRSGRVGEGDGEGRSSGGSGGGRRADKAGDGSDGEV